MLGSTCRVPVAIICSELDAQLVAKCGSRTKMLASRAISSE
jgi:hypothetical protein